MRPSSKETASRAQAFRVSGGGSVCRSTVGWFGLEDFVTRPLMLRCDEGVSYWIFLDNGLFTSERCSGCSHVPVL